jgi:hypothetical protein
MSGIPGPFAREYAYEQLLAGQPRSLFNMLPAMPIASSPAASIPMQSPAPAARGAALPAVAPPTAFSAPVAQPYGSPQGAPLFPPGMEPAPSFTPGASGSVPPSSPPAEPGFFDLPDAAGMQRIGLASSIAGAVVSIAAAINGAKIAKIQGRAQARALEHEAFMSNMNARAAERNAGAVMQQGRAAIAQMTAEAGQVKARQRVSAAARGVVVDQGSARDVTDTTEIVKEVQRVAINRRAVAQAADARIGATNMRNQSLLSRVGAGSMRSAADSISSLSAGASQFISSTGGFMRDYAAYRRRN